MPASVTGSGHVLGSVSDIVFSAPVTNVTGNGRTASGVSYAREVLAGLQTRARKASFKLRTHLRGVIPAIGLAGEPRAH